MKLRNNSLCAIECRSGDFVMRPIVLAGGMHAETNRLAMIENMERIAGGKWSARIVYEWRSDQHLKRWMSSGARWRKSWDG